MKNDITSVIGLDLGTSAMKGVLMDNRGNVIAEAGASTSFLFPQDGWIEVDPEQHYHNVCAVLRQLAAAVPGEVAAVAMAAASGNALLTDAEGKPLTRIINWMDQRTEEQPLAALTGLTVDEVMQVTGWPCLTSFPLAHLAWLQQNRPELYSIAGHYAMDTDWLLYRLTGQWRMDHSTATTFHLQEQMSGTYYAPFLQRLAIAPEKLSTLVDSGTPVGPLTAQALCDTGLSPRTLVVTGSFDHPSAARAMGVLEPGQLMLSCGTSWVGFTPLMDRRRILEAQLLCDPFLSADGGPWGGIFSVPYIGRAVDWYLDHIIAPGDPEKYQVFNALAAEAHPGSDGLEIDLRDTPRPIEADRKNISRAVMEGAARLLHTKIRELASHGLQFNTAVLVGGPSASPIWPQIIAETTGMTVTIGGRSAGAKGAAMLAGMGVGMQVDVQ